MGWIKIHRSLLDWEWYDDINTCRLFLHLLLKANFEQKKWHGVTVERGQVVTSLNTLSEETGLTRQQVRTALTHLISTHEITQEITHQYTTITICKYDSYQGEEIDGNTVDNTQSNTAVTQHQHSDNTAVTLTKEYKEYKEHKEGEEIKKKEEIDKSISEKKEKNHKPVLSDEDAFIDSIYAMYPSKCPVRGTSLGKTHADKKRIRALMRTYTREQIRTVVEREVRNKLGKYSMKNFSTFLNNFPDPNEMCDNSTPKSINNNLPVGFILEGDRDKIISESKKDLWK